MREVLRSNDLVRLSFLSALLADAGIETIVLDDHTSIIQGSLDILPRRLMVASPAMTKLSMSCAKPASGPTEGS